MRPCRTAMRTASVRLAAPSFPQIDATWNLPVGTLADGHVDLVDLVASRDPERNAAVDAVADQQFEQVLGRSDRVAVELDHHVADEDTGSVRRAAGCDADDKQRVLGQFGAPL